VTTDVISRAEIEDLFSDYNAALDDRDLERWLSFFMETCSYVVTTRENVDRGWSIAIINCETRGMMIDRIAAIQTTMYFLPRQQRRIVSGVRVAGAEGAAARLSRSSRPCPRSPRNSLWRGRPSTSSGARTGGSSLRAGGACSTPRWYRTR
jgi:hypothetical protein